MPFNGSGTFTRVHNWQQDSAANIDITDSRMDAEDDGFATGLSTAICKDGQTTLTANIPFATFHHGPGRWRQCAGRGDAETGPGRSGSVGGRGWDGRCA